MESFRVTPSLPAPSPAAPAPQQSSPAGSLLSPAKRGLLLSPNKQHLSATPKRSPARSPRRSPQKPVLHAKNVSFTPQREKQPPRAWERRPATPFIPRDDKQKIWKRVPLGELGVDINRPISRREQESKQDYVRVVKKLKIEHDDEDKENEFGVKAVGHKAFAEDLESLKRRERRDFVTMRVEEDEIRGSPKKKLRAVVTIGNRSGTHLEPEEYKEEINEDSAYAETDAQSNMAEEVTDEEHAITETGIWEEKQISDAEAAIQPAKDQQNDEATTRNQESRTSELEHILSGQQQPRASISAEAKESNLEPASNSPSASAIAPTDNHEDGIVAGEEDVQTTPSPTKDMESGNGTQDSEADGSSSPPTILAENVTVDELEAREAESPSMRMIQGVTGKEEAAQESLQEQQTEAVPRRISDDEKAFLRDFMSRSRADKAAREQAESMSSTQAVKVDSLTENVEKEIKNEETVSGEHNVSDSLPTIAARDDAPASPLRRSKRAAVTSLPRPQIQLKRASGNEFIFQANKSTSTANTALITKTNTKKNKGPAMNVLARLQQLVAQRAKDTTTGGSDDENDRAEDASDPVNATNKRKRGSDEDSARPKKVLRWNEEQLVSYQEAQPLSWQEDRDVDAQKDSDEEATEKPSLCVKLTLKMNSVPEKQEQHEQLASSKKSSKSTSFAEDTKDEISHPATENKVRRARGGIAGSVNGTPAPKRSRRLLMDAEQVEDERQEALQSTSVASGAADKSEDVVPRKQAVATLKAPATRKSQVPTLASNNTKKSVPASNLLTGAPSKSEKQARQIERKDASAVTRKLRTRT